MECSKREMAAWGFDHSIIDETLAEIREELENTGKILYIQMIVIRQVPDEY